MADEAHPRLAAGPDDFDVRQDQLAAEARVAQPGVDVVAIEPGRRIHQMRIEQGMEWPDVADAMEITIAAAKLSHMRWIQGAAIENAAEARAYDREVMLAELDALAAPHWVTARAGGLDSGKFLLSVLTQRGKIQGLERPEEGTGESRTIVVVGQGAEEYAADLQRIADADDAQRKAVRAQAERAAIERNTEDAEVVEEGG